MLFDGAGAGGHGRSKSVFIENHVIGGEHQAHGGRIVVKNDPRGIGRAGRGVATDRFGEDVVGRNLVEELAGGLGGRGRGHDPESLCADQRQDAVGGDPEQGTVGRQREELFWSALA